MFAGVKGAGGGAGGWMTTLTSSWRLTHRTSGPDIAVLVTLARFRFSSSNCK